MPSALRRSVATGAAEGLLPLPDSLAAAAAANMRRGCGAFCAALAMRRSEAGLSPRRRRRLRPRRATGRCSPSASIRGFAGLAAAFPPSTCRPAPSATGSEPSLDGPRNACARRPHRARAACRSTSCTRISGAEAPAVTPDAALAREPFRACRSLRRVDHVGIGAQALGQLAQPVAVRAARAADDDRARRPPARAPSPRPAGSAWRSRCPAAWARARCGKRRFTAARICAASSTDSVVCVTTASGTIHAGR